MSDLFKFEKTPAPRPVITLRAQEEEERVLRREELRLLLACILVGLLTALGSFSLHAYIALRSGACAPSTDAPVKPGPRPIRT